VKNGLIALIADLFLLLSNGCMSCPSGCSVGCSPQRVCAVPCDQFVCGIPPQHHGTVYHHREQPLPPTPIIVYPPGDRPATSIANP
jgi:hypothetical protein